MFTLPPNQSELRAMNRRAEAQITAALEPNRMIYVTVAPHIVSARTPYAPRRFSFSMPRGTRSQHLVAYIHSRLPEIPHPFSITTSGPEAETLSWETPGELGHYLPSYDAGHLELRLRVHDPALKPAVRELREKRSIGERFRNAFGWREESVDEMAGEQILALSSSTPGRSPRRSDSTQSALPTYKEAVAPKAVPSAIQPQSWFREQG